MRSKVAACETLIGLANRCLVESSSRELDADIYCAIHGIRDSNTLLNESLKDIRANGFVLVTQFGHRSWAEAPRFTSQMECAAGLVPDGLYTISNEPRIVCATALTAHAILGTRTFRSDEGRRSEPIASQLASEIQKETSMFARIWRVTFLGSNCP